MVLHAPSECTVARKTGNTHRTSNNFGNRGVFQMNHTQAVDAQRSSDAMEGKAIGRGEVYGGQKE
jgi:hypothetical protein